MKLTCDEATKICDKSQYKESSFLGKLKLVIHLFLCKKCGLYSKQNTIMTKCYENYSVCKKHQNSCLCEEEKEHMNQKIKEKI